VKIVIDALGIGRPGGARTATLNTLVALGRLDAENQYLAIVEERQPELVPFANLEQRVVPIRQRMLMRLWAQARLPRLLRREEADLVHYTRALGAFGAPCPAVITIFDVTILALPHFYPAWDVWYWRHVQPRMLQGIDKIIAISYNTRRDLMSHLGVPGDKVAVVYLAPEPRFRPQEDPAALAAIRRKYGLPADFLLYVGLTARKKNLPVVLRALHCLRTEAGLPHHLVMTGRPFRTSDDRAALEALTAELDLGDRVHVTGYVPAGDLPLLYGAASLLVYPSLHEGFGLVPLEAMACGTPVVAANTSAIPEATGDAALLVDDPSDEAALAGAVQRVLTEPGLAREMRGRGLAQAARFSWERTAREVLAIYREVATS
jgi:glycosyltransferase involved in cell wall biosynthesis